MQRPDGHPTSERLVDLAEGRPVSTELHQHVAGCAACTVARAQLEQLIGLLRTDAAREGDEEPPDYVVTRAQRLLRQRHVPSLIATLVFSSAQRPMAAGVRSLDSTGQQLVFEAGDYELDLRLVPTPESGIDGGALHAVSGQVLGPCSGGGSARLTQDVQSVAEGRLSEQCEFALAPVPAGTYTLIVQLADMVVEVPSLEVGGG